MTKPKYESMKDQREHIYRKPDMYIGAIIPPEEDTQRETWLFDVDSQHYYKSKVQFPEPIERLYLEAISNSGNNADETRRAGRNPGKIWVWCTSEEVCIKNTGNIIPVIPNEARPEYLNPELIFGVLLTSSNYDPNKPRMGCGTNGLGAKLINVFSSNFRVTVADHENHKIYRGMWENNMTKHSPGIVEDWDGEEGYVEVSWILDFERFGIQKYSEDILKVFARYAVDFSYTCKVPVYFNDVPCDKRNVGDFIRLIWNEYTCEGAQYYYEWEENFAPKGKKINYDKHVAKIELAIVDTPDDGMFLSFVNGLITPQGGVHVKEVYDQVVENIKSMINKGKKANARELTAREIKPHFSFVLNCRLANPQYRGQEKSQLLGPKIKINLNKSVYNQMMKWEMIEQIYAFMEAKELRKIKKDNCNSRGKIRIKKAEDATAAGTKESDKCILLLSEGDSANNYAEKLRDYIGGQRYIGTYPLRGKVLNVTNASVNQIHDNKEIQEIKALLGLQECLDYSLEENRSQLRYGKVVICADADTDGKHICAIVTNLFYQRYRSLIEMGMIYYLQGTMLRVVNSKGKVVARYHSEYDFSKHVLKKGEKVKYYKGLASSEDADIEDDYKNALVIQLSVDDFTGDRLRLAFDSELTDHRKEWISNFNQDREREIAKCQPEFMNMGSQTISNFIETELILYTMNTLTRAIPCYKDGFKESIRKIVYYALTYFNKSNVKKSQIKVSEFSSLVSAKTGYHHGPTSLEGAVMKLAQSFVGTNNIPILIPKGQVGSRNQGPSKTPAARYPYVALNPICKFIYYKDLLNLVPRRKDEDGLIESEWIPAIIPMHVVNGACGIATGWSTFIPNHNPLDVVEWLIRKCNGEEIIELKPYYRDFKGKIEILDKKFSEISVAEEEEGEEIEHDEIAVRSIKGKSMRTIGNYEITFDNKGKQIIEITELPIGVWNKTYKQWLEKLEDNKLLKRFTSLSKTDSPHYILEGFKPLKGKINANNLGLCRSFGISNMTLVDEQGRPYKFSDMNQIMEAFYESVLELFVSLRNKRIKDTQDAIEYTKKKIQFADLVSSGQIEIIAPRGEPRIKKQDVLNAMDKYDIPHEIFLSKKVEEDTEEGYAKLLQELEKQESELTHHTSTAPRQLWVERLEILRDQLLK